MSKFLTFAEERTLCRECVS